MSEEITTPEVKETEEVNEGAESTTQTPTLESLQEELDKLRAAHEKAKQEKERLIRKNKEMKAEAPSTPDTSELVKPWKTTVAVAELRAAGLDADQAKALLPMLDLGKVDIADEGVAGLTEQVDALREKFPQLFTSEVKKTVRKVDTSDKTQKASPPSVLSDATKKMLGLS